MKHKVSELEGVLLDAAVVIALAGGVSVAPLTFRAENGDMFILGKDVVYGPDGEHFHPSTDWGDGGPIIEREQIVCWAATRFIEPPNPKDHDTPLECWNALHPQNRGLGGYHQHGTVDVGPHDGMFGPTPLIAAMRAYVASKLGDEVEL